jgi:hypothetical protein
MLLTKRNCRMFASVRVESRQRRRNPLLSHNIYPSNNKAVRFSPNALVGVSDPYLMYNSLHQIEFPTPHPHSCCLVSSPMPSNSNYTTIFHHWHHRTSSAHSGMSHGPPAPRFANGFWNADAVAAVASAGAKPAATPVPPISVEEVAHTSSKPSIPFLSRVVWNHYCCNRTPTSPHYP